MVEVVRDRASSDSATSCDSPLELSDKDELAEEHERYFEAVQQMYEETLGRRQPASQWSEYITEENFKQWHTYVEGSDAINIKVKTVVDGSIEAIEKATLDFETRQVWDVQLTSMKAHHAEIRKSKSGDEYSYRRTSFTFISPMSLLVSDRDFYTVEVTRRNFPVEGAVMFYQKTIPANEEEYPSDPYKVRADIFVMGIAIPRNEELDSNDMGIKSFGTCDYYTVTSTNPMGYIPLSLVNSCAGSIPRQWFSGLQ